MFINSKKISGSKFKTETFFLSLTITGGGVANPQMLDLIFCQQLRRSTANQQQNGVWNRNVWLLERLVSKD